MLNLSGVKLIKNILKKKLVYFLNIYVRISKYQNYAYLIFLLPVFIKFCYPS